jgi:hypothetical protein
MFEWFKKKQNIKTDETNISNIILSIHRLIQFQIKLVDVVCKRDVKKYKTNNLKIISLTNSDWVFSYIYGISTSYLLEAKITPLNNDELFTDIISDVLHMLRVNNSEKSSEHREKIKSYIDKKLFQNKNTDFYKGFVIGVQDYSFFLKISENKDKINKILPCMKLCHYLCDELGMPRISETSEHTQIKKKLK